LKVLKLDGTTMEKLVEATKYSKRIKELNILARIELNHPVIVREEVAQRLADAVNKLPEELFLQVDSGYRSKETQKNLWQYRSNKVNDLVADPSREDTAHNTGGAIDVTLQNNNGKEINLSEPFDKYYAYPELRSKKITIDAQNNRLLLNKVMLEAGFAPNPKEYWHFSYGDKVWADYYKKDVLFREIDSIDKKVQYSFPRVIFNKAIKKLWWLVRLVTGTNVNY